MKKIILILLPLLMMVGCKKDLTSLNVDPKNPQSVPSRSLFTNAQHTLANTLASSSVNLNIFRLIVQYWTETTYVDESQFDLNTRQIPRGVWNTLYRDVLKDFEEAKRTIPSDVADANVQKNQITITDIMEVYTWYYLVTTFGNIPYTDALNIENPFPKYDDQKAIVDDLLKRLDADITALNISAESFGSADIVYEGDVAAWKKFANSLKLKIGMTIADADAAKAKTTVESAVASGVFTSNADNAQFNFLSGPPNTNPIWVDLVQSGRKDFVATNTIVNKMKLLGDPRMPYYFTFDATGSDYSGGVPGASNNYATFSKPAGPLLVPGSTGMITNPDFPHLLLSYDEVEFFLADEGVYFSELSPRPHDTGMVTLAGTQNFSEFELHLRAVFGLPIYEIKLERAGASSVILAGDHGVNPRYDGLTDALNHPQSDVRIFGKPSTRPYRRMGVALTYDEVGSDVHSLVSKAKKIASEVSVKSDTAEASH